MNMLYTISVVINSEVVGASIRDFAYFPSVWSITYNIK